MYTIVGFTKNNGVIKATNTPWTNYLVHCTFKPDKEVKNLVGSTVKDIKVPGGVFDDYINEIGIDNVLFSKVAFDLEVRSFNGTEKLICTEVIPVEG